MPLKGGREFTQMLETAILLIALWNTPTSDLNCSPYLDKLTGATKCHEPVVIEIPVLVHSSQIEGHSTQDLWLEFNQEVMH